MSDRPKRLKRETADRLAAEAGDRIRDVNGNAYWPWCIDRAVLFGSYVNTDNDRLGDLDLALHIVPRYKGERMKDRLRACYDALVEVHPSLAHLGGVDDERTVTYRRTVQVVRGRSGYISIHSIEMDGEAVFSGTTKDLCVGTIRRLEE